VELFVTWCFCYGARDEWAAPLEIRVDSGASCRDTSNCRLCAAAAQSKLLYAAATPSSDLNPQYKCQDQICQQTRPKSALWEQICSFELKDQELLRASMEALVNSLDTAALSREQLEAELTKLRSENDQLRMDADDPFQLLRDLPEDEPRPSPSKLNRGKASASGERRASTARRAPLGPPPPRRGTLDITKFFAPDEAARYRRCADKGAAEAAVRAARAAEKERAKPPDVIKEWAARHPNSGEIAQLGGEMVAAVSRGTTSLPLDQLVQMGFERGAAAATLVACANDVTQAASLLSEAADMARIKREEHLRRDKTWRKRGQYEAKLAGLDHKGPQHVAALALTQPTIPLALLEAPSVDCVWDFIESTNEEYDRLHEAYERQFWGERMALSSADYSPENESASKEALEAFLRDSDRLAKCHSLKEGLFTTERQKTILDGFVRVFDAYQMDPAAVSMRSDCVPLERALTDQRKALTLSVDGAPKSAPQLRTILRTSADENTRERAWNELRRVGPCIADGLCALVKRRNAMARALGFEDFYDYKVTKTEGFGKKKLFEMLDALRDGTSALNERARASLDDDDRKPWNISRATSGDETALDAYFPFGKALEAWGRSFAALGIRYRGSTMTLDLLERQNKYSNGFCHWPRTAYVRRDHSLRPSATNFTSLCDPLQTGSGRVALKTLMTVWKSTSESGCLRVDGV
jgi:hypothetical protein